ncbi:MAG TPA: hypothetical protein VGB91_13260, partial [Rhizomicrobium sp.]
MGMKIEGRNAFHKPGPIEFGGDFEGRRRAVRLFRGTQAETVPDPQAQAAQKRKAEIAEALPCRNGGIAVVMEFERLPRPSFALGQIAGIADIVMGAHEERVIGIVEKRAYGGDLREARLLRRPRRVEADDDERIDAGQEFAIEGAQAGIRPAFG